MLEQSLFISLCVIAIWGVFLPDEIFGKIGDCMERTLPKWMHSPIFSCPFCMSFWYGIPIHILRFGVTEQMPFTILAAMGMSLVFVKFLPENWGKQ